MPIETSPIPFGKLQLPYTPLFDPTAHAEIAPNGTVIGSGGGGPGMDMHMMQPPISHGPASVAASAIIGPTPGGVAGPHRPIPALPDAGYTAPTLRAASITGYPQAIHPGHQRQASGPGGEGTVYAGGSLYGSPQPSPYLGDHPHAHGPIHHPQHVASQGSVYSDGWSASLPAPRRAPIVTPLQPSGHHHHHQHQAYGTEGDRGRSHDRSPSQHTSPRHHHHANRESEFDDGASDASYYAMPRQTSRHHRSSSQGSSASELSSPEIAKRVDKGDGLHRRTLSNAHRQGRNRSQSISSMDHDHSPVSPSPLRAAGERKQTPRARRSSMGVDDDLRLGGLEVDERRARRSSHTLSPHPMSQNENHHSASRDNHKRGEGGRPVMQRQKSNLTRVEGSQSDSEETSARRSAVRERSTSRLGRRSKDDGDASDGHGSEGRRSPQRSPGKGAEQGRVRRVASARRSHRAHEKREDDRGEREESPYHRPHLPVDHSPVLSPYSDVDYGQLEPDSRSRRHSHDHRHHFADEQHGYENEEPRQHSQHHHRRTNSDASHQYSHQQQHREYTPPPQAGTLHPGQSASVIGGSPQYHHHHHHQPHGGHPISAGSRRDPNVMPGSQPFPVQMDGGQSVHPFPQHQQQMGMMPPGQMYDDGGSATGMTFLDQPMGGRVSQYGLPKYAHNPKVDYRRFCVQRGNADVFID